MNRTLKTMTDGERKALPVFDGALAYFPNALALIAENSLAGQAQHEPDMPLMWHRHKSRDELGSLARHLLDYAIAEAEGDYEGMLSATKAMAWRACAHAERFVATTEDDPERYQKVCTMRGESRRDDPEFKNLNAYEKAVARGTKVPDDFNLCLKCPQMMNDGVCNYLSNKNGVATTVRNGKTSCRGYETHL